MSDNLKDILSNLNPEVDQEMLFLYLQGKLNAEQQHEVEKNLIDDDFDADALEGLQNIKDKKKIKDLIDQLNLDLKKKTEKKKKLREKLKLTLDPWMIIALVLILVLVIVSFFILHKQLNP